MSESDNLPGRLKDLIEGYLDGTLDEAGMRDLEEYLYADEAARHYFVRYARLHTDLHLEVRARGAGARALQRIENLSAASGPPANPATSDGAWSRPRLAAPAAGWRRLLAPASLGLAAGLLVTVAAVWWWLAQEVGPQRPDDEAAVAWLVNAQDCTWTGPGPTGNLQAGRLLRIERGWAEIHFRCGARIVLEGPSVLKLVSSKSVRLTSGKLTARVPPAGSGFEVLSPHGKVIDLGTEFGVRSDDGSTEVYVFKGKVEALPAQDSPAPARTVNLTEHQSAQISRGQVTVRPAQPPGADHDFVRDIVPPPVVVPRTLRLEFDRAQRGGVRDRDGLRTGLTHRLPGTGHRLADNDGNLCLNRDRAQLELTTTNSDLNTQYQLHHGEYLGARLADLGFTGKEDFAVKVTIPKIPALEDVGQFGLYAGAQSNCNIRGGLIGHKAAGQYTQFLVNNKDGKDTDDICKVGLLFTGTDLRLTLERTRGKYALTVENLTNGSTSTLTIRHPDFLDAENDLYVGLFGANTQSEVRRTLTFKDFQATVWAVAPANPR
jgi:ferric-dicitrate binding protein FerR (iron transport regulator)